MARPADRPCIRQVGYVCATCIRYDWLRMYCVWHMTTVGRQAAIRGQYCANQLGRRDYKPCPECRC
jgi:hypothetical protein